MTHKTAARVTASFALLMAVQLLTSLGAIVLLGRMSPAIQKILRDNVASSEAVERMALALAESRDAPDAAPRFHDALGRARRNITETDEATEVATLERVGSAALKGDSAARLEATAALGRLGAVNRSAMQSADQAAQRLGSAGAWAAVLLGLLGLAASALTLHRLQRRVLDPIQEIALVAAAYRRGDLRRRCASPHATDELEVVMATLNELFDQKERMSIAPPMVSNTSDRAIVVELLDERSQPSVVIAARGELVAANGQALELLAGDRGPELRAALAAVPRGETPRGISDARQVGDTKQWLCALSPLPSDDGKAYAPPP